MSIMLIQELLRDVVAEVVACRAAKGDKGTTKGPPAHLMTFLVQACSILPEYVLVFAKARTLTPLFTQVESIK